jgi:hypothetical protein
MPPPKPLLETPRTKVLSQMLDLNGAFDNQDMLQATPEGLKATPATSAEAAVALPRYNYKRKLTFQEDDSKFRS